jgi:hypothetical protein
MDEPETVPLFALAQHSSSPVGAARRSPVILNCMLDGVSWQAYVKTARWTWLPGTGRPPNCLAITRRLPQRNVLWLPTLP